MELITSVGYQLKFEAMGANYQRFRYSLATTHLLSKSSSAKEIWERMQFLGCIISSSSQHIHTVHPFQHSTCLTCKTT